MKEFSLKETVIGSVSIGPSVPLVIIAGPCVIESETHALKIATFLQETTRSLGLPLIYKSSFDKANRTSKSSFRGLGIEDGCKILKKVRDEIGVPVVTDVHSPEDCEFAAAYVDLLQIPAFLCRQTDLLQAAGASKLPVMIKKGQFLAPEDMAYAAEKCVSGGASGVLLCERGASFGYRDLVVDFRSFSIMRKLGYPVVFDATHSVQSMGGAGGSSGGRREFVPHLARAAVAFGVDAVFLEVHDNPEKAPSDGPNMLPLESVVGLFADLKVLSEASLQTRDLPPASGAADSPKRFRDGVL